LVWRTGRAGVVAAIPAVALVAVEVGTSRTADRHAQLGDRVHDRVTSYLFDAAAALAIIGGVVASRDLQRMTMRRDRAAFVVGTGLMAAALALSSSARAELGRFHRNALTIQVDHVVVATGPYRYVRHPLYAATALAFVGIGTVLGNWSSLALAALPVAALTRRIGVEEDMLRNHFGESYRTYQRQTDRLIPRIW
jgi:protein-S-isoprenylcysteine O-methyltransferase Ste14